MTPWRSQRLITATILIITFAYAILRYNIIRGVAWEHLPMFISNKAISLAAVFFIALSYILGPLARFWPKRIVPLLTTRRFFGLLGFGLAALHGLLSLLLFTSANYPRLFSSDGTLNLTGELSMLFGVIALFVFTVVALSCIPSITDRLQWEQWQRIQRLGYAGLILVLLHVLLMGYRGWLQPSQWPGNLLPISLIAAAAIIMTILLRIVVMVWRDEKGSTEP